MKLRSFYCNQCEIKFEAKGAKQERMDPVFGASWSMAAECPKCEHQASELKDALKAKNGSSGEENAAASCPTGTCPFMAN
jgi:hypothetical protein